MNTTDTSALQASLRVGLSTCSCALLLWAALAGLSSAEPVRYQITVRPAAAPSLQVPVRVPIAVPVDLADDGQLGWVAEAGTANPPASQPPVLTQMTGVGLLTESSLAEPREGYVWRELHLLLPAGATTAPWQGELLLEAAAPDADRTAPSFAWSYRNDRWAELKLAGRPVLRYMHEPLDASTAERRGETYKVYHHVYDPTGTQLVTKGPGGLFPHHRGLFYGFNRISYNGQQADVWHCNNGEQQSHRATMVAEAGPVLGRHRVLVGWQGRDGEPFAEEQREVTAYAVAGGQMIDFVSRLVPLVSQVRLDGDPQHAGFQFRASQEVPDSTKQLTYYLRPDGRGQPGEFRNWPDDQDHRDLPWNALSFVLGQQRYTCCYLDSDTNPKPARYSERDYGRFGSYFPYDLTPERPLVVRYRIWLQEGEMEVTEVQRQHASFVSPPSVTARMLQD